MLGSLESSAGVERVRAGRTKLVKLTAAGLKVFEVLDEYVASGDVGAWVDRAIVIHDDPVVLALHRAHRDVRGAIRWTYQVRARPSTGRSFMSC